MAERKSHFLGAMVGLDLGTKTHQGQHDESQKG